MDYILLILADILLALNFSANKVYQNNAGTSLKAGLRFNYMYGLLVAIVFFAVNGFKFDISSFSAIMSIINKLSFVGYNLVGFKLMKSGAMSIYTMFLMTGGMTLPYIWGVLFLGEELTVFRILALIVIFAGVVLANLSKTKINASQIWMCIAVFVFNGITSITSKVHQIEQVYRCVGENDFIVIGGIFQFIVCGIICLFLKNKENGENLKINARLFLMLVLISVLTSGTSSFLLLFTAKTVPATLLYPFVTGGTIVCTTIAATLAFKEHVSRNHIIGVVLCFLGTVLFLF